MASEAAGIQILRSYELRLLRCTLSSSPPLHSQHHLSFDTPLHNHLNHIITCLETGHYYRALTSDAAKLILGTFSTSFEVVNSADSADLFYAQLIDRVESFVLKQSEEDDHDTACRIVLVLCVALSALFVFTQCNMTGPPAEFPCCPLLENGGNMPLLEWEIWARNQLISAGSHLLGKYTKCQYLVLAKMLLMWTRDFLFRGSPSSLYELQSISWWLARLLLIQQRILDDRSSVLFDLLQVTIGETLHHFGTFEKVTGYWGATLHDEEAFAIVSMVQLEAGIIEYVYCRDDPCRKHFNLAEEAAGLQLSITGVLGFRTVHQAQPKAQRVLVTNTRTSNGASISLDGTTCTRTQEFSVDEDNLHQDETYESCDIYLKPKLLHKNSKSEIKAQDILNDDLAAASLNEKQQAVILARCLLIEKSTRQDEMQRWDMAPYIEAIDSQQSSCFILRSFCDLLRIRWESARSHTRSRALELLEKLVSGIQMPSPGVAERIPFVYAAYLPTIPALKKEYGEILLSFGLIGEAITIFEDLELWDHLIQCNSRLGKKAAAVELIKTRLSEMPNDARLWCSLGDVTNDDTCYEKALEVSSNRSARAKRSLARSAYNRGDYEKSKILWESAMTLNSLYPDGWFALGAACLKARDVEKGVDAFTWAVQLDPENGEAWNNLACLHMTRKKNKEAFIAFKEALKFKRDSWKLWENFSHVAKNIGSIGQALEAVQKVLKLTDYKRIDTELLEEIISEMEEKASSRTTDVDAVRISRETETMLEFLGKVLQQIVKNTSTASIWGLYARWYKIKGDLTMQSEALLKQVRSYQGSDLWNDVERFNKFASASLELCGAYIAISSSTSSRRELFTAEMHLKNTIKQAYASYSETEEFKAIVACLEEVTTKLQSA